MSVPTTDNTCCVVITFHPDEGFADRLAHVAAQVNRTVIVDNGSNGTAVSMIKDAASRFSADTILNDRNIGQAAALSQGLAWATEHSYQWMLTMDQDSIPYDNLLTGVAEVYLACPDKEKVAVIGPNYLDRNGWRPHLDLNDTEIRVMHTRPDGPGPHRYVEAITVITTGSITSIEAAKVIGSFRDEFFIDHVDDEYCLRARAKGFKVLLGIEMLMEHVIGTPKYADFLWKKGLVTPNASLIRRYYQARNHLVLIMEYRKLEPAWVRWSIKVRIKEIILMLCLETDRPRKSWSVIRGLFDGLVGRMGKMEV